MVRFEAENFDPEQIADSGQCFRWRRVDEDRYLIPAFGRRLELSYKRTGEGNMELSFHCGMDEWDAVWKDYFDMDTDYGAVGRAILDSGDAYLAAAYAHSSGIRILRQDLWEVIISFMISQNNNIPRISGSVEKLCEACSPDAHFPSPSEMDPELFDDASLGLGYRAEYLKDMVIYAREHPDFPGSLYGCSPNEAFETLLWFKGIGKKVAGCICLFGLHDTDAFPIDTHIRKVLDREYPGGFDPERYRGFAGIVQQYMFRYERLS